MNKQEVKDKLLYFVRQYGRRISLPGIYSDASGIGSLRTEGCSCCATSFRYSKHDCDENDAADEIIQSFTMDEQIEIVKESLKATIKEYGLTPSDLE